MLPFVPDSKGDAFLWPLLRQVRDVLRGALEARKLLPAAFVLMLGFLALTAWDGYSSTRELLNAQAYVQRTHEVLHEMDGVEDGVQDAREAWLHYVLSPEKVDQVNFENAAVRTWTQLDHVANLDPDHQASIKQLRGFIGEELQQLRADLRTKYTKPIYHTPESDANIERVREAIQKFKDEQERLLRDRNQAAQARSRQITRSVFSRIMVFSVFMAVLFLLVMRDSKKLRVAEQKALLAQTGLEGSLLQLKSETENSRLLNELQADFQICVSATEAYKVAASYLQRLMPESLGTVFAIDSSQDVMDAQAIWPATEAAPLHQVFSREDCCAVRGGRLHAHLNSPKGIDCRHFTGAVPATYICFPLSALGETLGVLHLSAPSPEMFTENRRALIQQIGEYAALRLANLKLKEELQHQSLRDPLTGLYNRRFLETTLEQELGRAARGGAGIGLIMADIDGFKLFNDKFGHDAGDLVLKEIAALLRRSVRAEDIVCRYGGEEFLAVVPESTLESVQERAEQMRVAVSKLQLDYAGSRLGKITASFGVSYSQDGAVASSQLLRYADDALYDAKRSGCDCVRLSEAASAKPPASALDPDPDKSRAQVRSIKGRS
jgi:diguanylate cyclase (GGDEF)-like protein